MKKKTPLSECFITLHIIIDETGIAKVLSEPINPEAIQKSNIVVPDTYYSRENNRHNAVPGYSLIRENGKVVTIKSGRLLKAFQWLQDKEHTFVTSRELTSVLALDRNQTTHVMNSLKTKGLIYYERVGNSYNIVRVDDIDRLKPMHYGAEE